MRNFIQKHPYLSCLGFNFIISALYVGYLFIIDAGQGKFTEIFFIVIYIFILTMISTLPALCIAVIDLYANQKLFNNKPLQYGLTAVESLLLYPSIFFKGINGYKEFFKNLFFEPDRDLYTHEVMMQRLFTVLLPIQSLGFKYIFDSANKKI